MKRLYGKSTAATAVAAFVIGSVTLPYTAFADAQSETNPVVQAYEKAHHASHTEKVAVLMSKMGLSREQAEFTATLDDKLAALEDQHKQIDLTNVKPMTNADIAADPVGYKSRLLSLDPSALAASVANEGSMLSRGTADVQKLMTQEKGFRTYTVQYADGSTVTMKLNSGHKVGAGQSLARPQASYQEDTFGSDFKSDGNWYDADVSITWQTNGGSAICDLSVFNLNYNFNKGTVTIYGFETGQDAYGTVGISNASWNEPYGSKVTATSGNPDVYAEAENEVVFNTTGSIGGSFDILSFSVNAGGHWTDYAIARLWPWYDEYDAVAAEYA